MNFPILKTRIRSTNDKIQFLAESDRYAPLTIDYATPIGDDAGYSPLELILISLSSCLAASTRIVLTVHLHKTVHAMMVEARGQRRGEHPSSFNRIDLRMTVVVDMDPAELQRVVLGAAERICPVYHLLKGNVDMAIEAIPVEAIPVEAVPIEATSEEMGA